MGAIALACRDSGHVRISPVPPKAATALAGLTQFASPRLDGDPGEAAKGESA
jgi:hypothetical protein